MGGACFAISYGLELAVLALQGNPGHLEIYISSFSLTGSQINNTGCVFFVLCVGFNIVNVWMEEGVFRGLFLKMFSETRPFLKANLIAAFLFGIWHIVMPVRSYVNGEMSFAAMALMGVGYIILSGIMGMKWGFLYRITMAAQMISFAVVLVIYRSRLTKEKGVDTYNQRAVDG